jgi:predicted ATPase/DNA-binding SARP family transcriptional activator
VVKVDVELVLLSRVSHRGLEITGSRLGGLLALLAADLRTGSSTSRMADALWPDDKPEHPAKALQVLVSRARARLGPDVILSTPTGYRLGLGDDQVDATALRLSCAASERSAREGDHAAALHHAEAGLALCDGAPDWVAGAVDPLSALRSSLLPAYRTLRRARALAMSRAGRRAEAIAPLRELAGQHPRDEEVLLELLRGEAATLGPVTALARYDAYRQALREELGSDPGPALQRLHRELLLADAPVVRHGVREEPNPLLGRDEDIAALAVLLQTARVTSIVGTGGLGKTRLAHAVVRRAPQRAVYFVGLAGVTTGDDVAAHVASALGVAEGVAAQIAKVLGPGPALLVLDNCEHVVQAAAELVQALVSSVPDLRVLTTSRAPLGLSSESVYPLPELDPATTVELFGRRARAARPDVELPPDVVGELCRSLDGLPLAVELAAARVRVMSVAEIAQRLDDRFSLLRGGARDAPQRHHTLHAVIDGSWQLLEPAGQRAMRALSVFPGGFTATAARQLLGDDTVLEQLVDQSLLRAADSGPGLRFRMLETVREFSRARREEAGETDRVLGDFLGWARDFGVRQHETALDAGLAVIRAEQDNLAYALRCALGRGDGATVAAVAAALGLLWMTESNFTRLSALAGDIPRLLSHLRPGPELVEATRTAAALSALSAFMLRGPRPLRALVTLRRLPPPATDSFIGAVQAALCAPDGRALQELCDSERPMVAAVANYAMSAALENANDLDGALRAARRMLGDTTGWMRAVAHARIGQFCLQVAPGEEAHRHLSTALAIIEEHGAWSSAVRARWAIVLADLQRGAFDEAERGLERIARGGESEAVGPAMFEVCARAEILIGRGDVEGGLGLWREAADRLAATGGPWTSEVQAVTVVVHARFGRLDLVGELAATLAAVQPATDSVVDFPVCGSLLLARAVADLGRGSTASGVRLIALAERLGWQRGFQPTMSPARLREVARQADGPAYAEAVSSFAGLDHDGLRAAARDHRTGSRRNKARDHR